MCDLNKGDTRMDEPFEMCVTCGVEPWGHGYCGEQCAKCAATPPAGADCEWYLMCTNKASVMLRHPILGAVPACARCAEKDARLRNS